MIIEECSLIIPEKYPEKARNIVRDSLRRNKSPKNVVDSVDFELSNRKFYSIKSIVYHINTVLRPWKIGYRMSKYAAPDVIIYDLVSGYKW